MSRRVPSTTPLGRILLTRNITAIQLSRACDIHPRTLTEYLSGRQHIKPDHMVRVCEYLEVEPDDLYIGELQSMSG